MFVCKLVNMKRGITKHVFINELYNYVFTGCTNNTITGDLIRVLIKYNLLNYLVTYAKGGTFPDKIIWKHIVIDEISKVEERLWKYGLCSKGVSRYQRVQPLLQVNKMYNLIRSNLNQRENIMYIVRILSIIEEGEPLLCPGCGKIFTDAADHVINRCSSLIKQRNDMWNNILDNIDVTSESLFISKDEEETLDILLGKDAPDIFSEDYRLSLTKEVGYYISEAINILIL